MAVATGSPMFRLGPHPKNRRIAQLIAMEVGRA
jgi:hypothetical protein